MSAPDNTTPPAPDLAADPVTSLEHIDRLQAENAALRKAIAAVRVAREDETFSCGCELANCGREGVYLQAINAAIAQTDERKAETE